MEPDMRIYEALITAALPYEANAIEHHEFGADERELRRRLREAMEKIAPLALWGFNEQDDDFAYYSNGKTCYDSSLLSLELVC